MEDALLINISGDVSRDKDASFDASGKKLQTSISELRVERLLKSSMTSFFSNASTCSILRSGEYKVSCFLESKISSLINMDFFKLCYEQSSNLRL